MPIVSIRLGKRVNVHDYQTINHWGYFSEQPTLSFILVTYSKMPTVVDILE